MLQYFDMKYYIQIKTDVSSYPIGKILSQMTLDNLGWKCPVATYLQKIILAKT